MPRLSYSYNHRSVSSSPHFCHRVGVCVCVQEIESLHSDHPPSWLARASVSVEGGSGSVHSVGYPGLGSPGSAVTGPGGPAGGRPGLGLDSRSYVSHTSHNTNPNFPLGANASTMSFGGDVDDDLDDDHHRGGGDKHDKDKT